MEITKIYLSSRYNKASWKRLVAAEAEFLVSIKAVRQQKCRMSPLTTIRTPYRRSKTNSCENRGFLAAVFVYILQIFKILLVNYAHLSYNFRLCLVHFLVVSHVVPACDVIEPLLIVKVPSDCFFNPLLKLE